MLFQATYVSDTRKISMTFHASCAAMAMLKVLDTIGPLMQSVYPGLQAEAIVVKPHPKQARGFRSQALPGATFPKNGDSE